jgi:hypothetical protein
MKAPFSSAEISAMAREAGLTDPSLGEWMIDYGNAKEEIKKFAAIVSNRAMAIERSMGAKAEWNYGGNPTEPGWYAVEANWKEPVSPLVYAAEWRDGSWSGSSVKIERWAGPHPTKESAEVWLAQDIRDEQVPDGV